MPHSSFVAVCPDAMEILQWDTGEKRGQICPTEQSLQLLCGALGACRGRGEPRVTVQESRGEKQTRGSGCRQETTGKTNVMTGCPGGRAVSRMTPRFLTWMAVGVGVAFAEMAAWEEQQVWCPLTLFQHSLSH